MDYNTSKWLSKKSHKSHKTSKVHLQSEARSRNEAANLIAAHAQSGTGDCEEMAAQPAIIGAPGSSLLSALDAQANDEKVVSAFEQSLWDGFSTGEQAFTIDDSDHAEDDTKVAEFERRADAYALWGRFDEVPAEMSAEMTDMVVEEEEYDQELADLLMAIGMTF
jgi:hypothetical protein